MPKLPWVDELSASWRPTRRRRAGIVCLCCGFMKTLRLWAMAAATNAVRRYARTWRRRWRLLSPSQGFVPLSFDPGEAYQFDWSHEYARLSGVTTKVKAAHMRLCYSRMQLVQIFPRESQEIVRGARTCLPLQAGLPAGHLRQHEDGGEHGLRRQGARLQPALSGAAPTIWWSRWRASGCGLGKGQVERQVGDVRGRLFVPIPRGRSYADQRV